MIGDEPEFASTRKFEIVHAVWHYYDCPREGVADFHGKPHIFKCQFDEADDDWTDRFWLMEIDQPSFEIAKEQDAIFQRWRAEFKLGNVPLDPRQPLVLPTDRLRYEELRTTVGNGFELKPERSVIMRARFVSIGGVGSQSAKSVEWLEP